MVIVLNPARTAIVGASTMFALAITAMSDMDPVDDNIPVSVRFSSVLYALMPRREHVFLGRHFVGLMRWVRKLDSRNMCVIVQVQLMNFL
jgi:hypothetical protein